jgi:hypothetical protein
LGDVRLQQHALIVQIVKITYLNAVVMPDEEPEAEEDDEDDDEE